MSLDLCQVNSFVLLFQGFIVEGDKQIDAFSTIMIALYFCVLHCLNLIHNDRAVSVGVTRVVGLISLVFLALRLLDLYYC